METNDNRTEQFIHLLSSNHYRIYAFIQSLVNNSSDVDDIMQDTSSIMWKKFDSFKPGTDFVSWGVTVAKYRVMEYWRKKTEYSLSEETLDLLADQSEKMMPELDNRLQALQECLKKLTVKDNNMLKLRYTYSCPAKQIAQRIGTTVNMVYRNMSRIKMLLSDCVHKQLRAEKC